MPERSNTIIPRGQKPRGKTARLEALRKLSRPQLYILTEIIARCPRFWRKAMTSVFDDLATRENVLRAFPSVPYADVMGALFALHEAFSADEEAMQRMLREEVFSAYEDSLSHATGYLFEKQ